MLLKKYTDYEIRLVLGQLLGTLGVLGLIASGSLGNASAFSLFMGPSGTYGFLRGFTTGFSGSLLGLSLVFSAAALVSVVRRRPAVR